MRKFYTLIPRQLCLVGLTLISLISFAQDGALDFTFGNHGKTKNYLENGNFGSMLVTAVAVQADGKIILAGQVDDSLLYNNIFLARYNSNGIVDSLFGTNGMIITKVNNHDCAINAVTALTDGKIVAVGNGVINSGQSQIVLRYTNNGTIDSSFGTNGITFIDRGNNAYTETAYSVSVQSDGKIVVSGSRYTTNEYDFVVSRLTTAGVPDSSFGGTGKVVTDFYGSSFDDDIGYSIGIQTDGKIVVGGTAASLWFGGGENFGAARYNVNGTLDNTFGSSGTVLTNMVSGNSDETGRYMIIQSDGKIVIAGWFGWTVYLSRYTTTGVLDNSFGTGGKVSSYFSSGFSPKCLLQETDSKLIVAGTITTPQPAFALIRYRTDGTRDSTFGFNGLLVTECDTLLSGELATCGTLQPDGKIILAGNASDTVLLNRYNYTCHPTSSTISQTECGSFTYYGHTYTSSGQFVQTIPNSVGCDSVVTLTLTIYPESTDTLVESICEGQSYFFNGVNRTQTGIYRDTLTSVNGCDSISTLTLTVNPLPTLTLNLSDSICSDASPITLNGFPIGGSYTGAGVNGTNFEPGAAATGSNQVIYTYVDTNSCTNFIRDTIVVYTCPDTNCHALYVLYPDTATPHNWFALNQSTGTGSVNYTWYWGDGSSSTGGAVSHTYSASGNYNICLSIADSIGCTDTYCDSSTYIYKTEQTIIYINTGFEMPTSVEEIRSNLFVSLNPNPASSGVIITTDDKLIGGSVILSDPTGKELMLSLINQNMQRLELTKYANGMYFITLVSTNGKRIVRKLIISR